ncbi:LysR family transcriptional regulator [Pseudonocardia acaciae]|uniref:LysR family transcriptional regulator n=1 Tax=Pseudonocardia acaciae TaxID=551276 RepID=UPI00048F0452|nr:LysR family transcriptional regulator [Pseudonocardia acaciae]
MDSRRLRYLLELARLGSMREVADALGTTTSTVSQQIAVLARETGTALVEPVGRRVRLTPAGRRLASHAVTILAAIEAAQLDLDPDAEPAGTVRVAGFATAIRRSLMPVAAGLAADHPKVRLIVHEHEQADAVAMLAANDLDLALTYDYNLAPAALGAGLDSTPLWSTPWGLAVPASDAGRAGPTDPADTLTIFRAFRHHNWIGNSMNRADEHVVRTLGSMAGFTPRLTHQADSLDLVEDLILAGFGVALLPADRPTRPGVRLLGLPNPEVVLRCYAVTRQGRATWPPLTLVLRLLTARRGPASA